MRLQDKVAIVTGGSRGIGRAIAEAYLKEGAKVVIASRKAEELEAAAAEMRAEGGTVLAVPTHTGQAEQGQALIERTLAEFGRLDILVNNAATNPHFGPVLQSEASHWQKTFEVNVMGYFWLCKLAAEHMIPNGGGKLINVASVAGLEPGGMMGVYSVSKAAVIMLTKVLAQELGADNVQVNAIAPGIIQTKFATALWSNDSIRGRLEENTPAGRLGQPEEIAGAAVYLASPESSYMTGQVLVIDGGMTITKF